jgi:hypothetical protein
MLKHSVDGVAIADIDGEASKSDNRRQQNSEEKKTATPLVLSARQESSVTLAWPHPTPLSS